MMDEFVEVTEEWTPTKCTVTIVRVELREKIARQLTIFIYGDVAEWDDLTPEGKELMLAKADKIKALIGEEAKELTEKIADRLLGEGE